MHRNAQRMLSASHCRALHMKSATTSKKIQRLSRVCFQAEKFRSKAQRSDLFRSHAQYVRYLFYLGKIRAVQLEYSEARDCLQQASRKAPSSCLGFRISADKWLILVSSQTFDK